MFQMSLYVSVCSGPLTWIDVYRALAKHSESYTSSSKKAAKLKNRYRKKYLVLTHQPPLVSPATTQAEQ